MHFSTHAPAEQPRAFLVSINDDGSERRQPVGSNQSVLCLERDLISHLSEQPFPDAFLAQLRDYCDARLAARADAQRAGRLHFPQRAEAR